MISLNILPLVSLIGLSLALPKARSPKLDSNPIPGESPLFATYTGKPTPIPANYTRVIPATASGPAGPDDLLFQNLLSAEWIIYSFYQQGVEAFTPSSFSDLGYPNSTYDRIAEIRDNEAGHIRIFQDEISSTSLKPGPCNYSFGFDNDPETFLALQVYIEVNSMAFLTGLVRESNTIDTSSALVAVAEVETRHNVWSLIDVWDVSPFAGPADTVYPYANQILALTNSFVVSGSCPSENPEYPYPNQNLPGIGFVTNTTTGHPGSKIQLEFSSDPGFTEGRDYYAVFFHGVLNISVPFDVKTNETVIPGEFDKGAGIIALAVADEAGAPTEDSVLAGPLLLLQQPDKLTLLEP